MSLIRHLVEIRTWLLAVLTLAWLLEAAGSNPAEALTLVIEGQSVARGQVTVISQVTFPSAPTTLTYRVSRPPTFDEPLGSQVISDFRVDFRPLPTVLNKRQDQDGNQYIEAVFGSPPDRLTVTRSFAWQTARRAPAWPISSPYPSDLPGPLKTYLAGTDLVQVKDSGLADRARVLVRHLTDYEEAASVILNWIADNVLVASTNMAFDAPTVFRNRLADAEGRAHLAAAMLRAVGFPTRVTVGLRAGLDWRWEYRGRTWSFPQAAGRYAWVETFVPELGWTAIDPATYRFWVPPDWLILGRGLDVEEAGVDGSLVWAGAGAPTIEEKFYFHLLEAQPPKVITAWPMPGSLIPARILRAKNLGELPPPEPPLKDSFSFQGLTPEQAFKLPRLEITETGPALTIQSDYAGAIRPDYSFNKAKVRPVHDAPTVKYPLNKNQELGQRVFFDCPFEPTQVSLGLVAGPETSGTVFVEIRQDHQGRPGRVVAVSRPDRLDGRQDQGLGPAWVNLDFGPSSILLLPGVYWVRPIYEGSGEAQWLFCPGHAWRLPGNGWQGRLSSPEVDTTINGDFFVKMHGYPRAPGLGAVRPRPWLLTNQ